MYEKRPLRCVALGFCIVSVGILALSLLNNQSTFQPSLSMDKILGAPHNIMKSNVKTTYLEITTGWSGVKCMKSN